VVVSPKCRSRGIITREQTVQNLRHYQIAERRNGDGSDNLLGAFDPHTTPNRTRPNQSTHQHYSNHNVPKCSIVQLASLPMKVALQCMPIWEPSHHAFNSVLDLVRRARPSAKRRHAEGVQEPVAVSIPLTMDSSVVLVAPPGDCGCIW
jgi:hypothetical protein